MAYDLTAVNAGTHAKIEKKFQDNLSIRSPLIMKFRKMGQDLVPSGKELTYPVIVEDGNADSFYGDDVLDVSRPQGLRPLTFSWKQFYSTVRIDGIEQVMNEGPEGQAKVLEGRMEQAETTTANKFEKMLGGVAAANVGDDGVDRNWNALDDLIADTNTSGTIGGLDRATYAQIRNQVYSTAITAFNTSDAGRIGMTELWVDCCQGGRKPNFGITTDTIWVLFQMSLQQNERILLNNDKELTDAGFPNISFMGMPVVFSDGINADHMYFLRIAKPGSTGGIFLAISSKQNFKMGKFIEPVDQDYIAAKILTAGELCTDAPYLQGVITNITG